MRAQAKVKLHTQAEKARVLDAHRSGCEDWLEVAEHNAVPRSTAYRWAQLDRVQPLPRGARAASTKVTPAIMAALEDYINENCQYTMVTLQNMVFLDFSVMLSTSTISRHLIAMLYTVKEIRVVPNTCNNTENKTKRKVFAEKLLKHQRDGNCIVYYDETNFNVFCKRGRGRAKKGERAVAVLPPSKGANLQVQCTVNSTTGLVLHRLQRGSIKMDCNAEFVEDISLAVKASRAFQEDYSCKKVIIVFDNAPCHIQTEGRVTAHADMELLRLAPYSPMCNPIEGCFNVLKSRIKDHLAVYRVELNSRPEDTTLAEHRMQILERAARASLVCTTPRLVGAMELHARDHVRAAEAMANMHYGV